MTVSAVILAAGRGDRMQTAKNKVLLPICGQALICHTIGAFALVAELDDIVVVVHPNEMEEIGQLVRPISGHCRLVAGGRTRRDSALAGVLAAKGDIVLIHDGARPFPSANLIRHVLTMTHRENAIIPILPIHDLLHRVDQSRARIVTLTSASDQTLVRVQTPQAFQRHLIVGCLEAAPAEIRDDASAVLMAGKSVATVPGEPTNIKVTCPDDLKLAEAIAISRG